VAERSLGIFQVREGSNHVSVQSWVEVVVSVLSLVGPLFFRLGGSNLEFVLNHTFGGLQGGEVFVDIIVNSEVWN